MNCQICQREVPQGLLEKHHFYPRSRRKSEEKRKNENATAGVLVCCDCGNQLHQLFTNKELAKNYNALEKILASEKVQNWAKWIRNKPEDFGVCMRRKK